MDKNKSYGIIISHGKNLRKMYINLNFGQHINIFYFINIISYLATLVRYLIASTYLFIILFWNLIIIYSAPIHNRDINNIDLF